MGRPPHGPNHEGSAQASAGVLVRLMDLINGETDTRALVLGVAQEAAQLCNSRMASVYLYNDDGELEFAAGTGLPTRLAEEIDRLGRTQAATAFLTDPARPTVLHPTPAEHYPSPLYKLAVDEGIRTLISVPLIYRGRLIGIMLIYNRERHACGEEEMELLSAVASYMALSVANAHLIETRRWEQKAQDQFLDVLSHELRTPLTSIMGFTQIIRRRIATSRDVDARVRDQLDLLWGQAQRLNRLLDTFVDMSNMQRGEFAVERNRLDLTLLLRNAVQQSLSQARSSHNISLDLPQEPVWIHGDAKRLEHVFGHVLANAIRYSPPDQPITLTCRQQPALKEAVVSITDHGPGIPSDMQKEIFKRFYPSDTRKTGGMGVGLYVSRAIIDAHGGLLTLESAPGTGTTVHIHLPA